MEEVQLYQIPLQFLKFSEVDMRILIILTILLSTIGCTPMYYKDLGQEASPSLSFDRDKYSFEAEDNGENIEMHFEAISNARSYGYGISAKNVIRFNEGDITFENGVYTATIPKSSDALRSYSPVSSLNSFSREAGKLDLIIFASTKDVPEDDWIIVKSTSVDLVLSGAPSLSVTDRKENSVVLESRDAVEDITYSVSVNGERSIEFDSSALPYTIDNIGMEALTLTISHKYTGTDSFSDEMQTIDIPAYDIRQSEIQYALEEDGAITVSNLPEGEYKHIGLYKTCSDGSLTELSVIDYDGTGGERIFTSDVLGNGFFASSLKIVVFNENADEENAKLSSVFSVERDIERQNEKIGRQSYSVQIPVSPLVSITAESIRLSGINEASVTVSDGFINISIAAGTLISRTKYSLKLTITVPDYGPVTKTIDFETKSFAGEYIWEATKTGGAEQFAVLVEHAPESSKANYYIYTSPNDIAFSSGNYEKLRISPLYENDSDIPSSGVSYNETPQAYKWNNEKWNNSDQKPISLSYLKTTYNSKDYVSAVVGSTANALITTITVETTSSVQFIEKEDGTCLMVFYNKMTGGASIGVDMGNKALLKNPAPNSDNFETDEYHYALILQEK